VLNRRDAMMRLGRVGLGAVTLPALLGIEKKGVVAATPGHKAKSCIYIFLWEARRNQISGT